MLRLSLLAVAFAAYGGSTAAIDTPAQQSTLVVVDCGSVTPTATIMTNDATMSYAGSPATINMGQVVKFTTSANHNVTPNTSASDPKLSVDFATTKCMMFTSTGTFGFHCSVHGFTGSVTVQ